MPKEAAQSSGPSGADKCRNSFLPEGRRGASPILRWPVWCRGVKWAREADDTWIKAMGAGIQEKRR